MFKALALLSALVALSSAIACDKSMALTCMTNLDGALGNLIAQASDPGALCFGIRSAYFNHYRCYYLAGCSSLLIKKWVSAPPRL
jgi:hypothetical protein